MATVPVFVGLDYSDAAVRVAVPGERGAAEAHSPEGTMRLEYPNRGVPLNKARNVGAES